jgi:hypothetical protein
MPRHDGAGEDQRILALSLAGTDRSRAAGDANGKSGDVSLKSRRPLACCEDRAVLRSPDVDNGKAIFHLQDAINNTSGHCRGSAKRVLNAAEVVKNKYSARAWLWFSNFFENVLIDHVKCLMLILIVRPRLSVNDGLT